MKSLAKTAVAIEILRSKCENTDSESEAEILVLLLENIVNDCEYPIYCLSAPEANVLKKVAIIRTPEVSLNLINPVIIDANSRVLSLHETCASFPKAYRNCFRYDTIFISNGFKKEIVQLKGVHAHLAQHAIDHLSGVIYHDRTIKLAVVRNGGKILSRDPCPCGSKERFSVCCCVK